MCVGPQKQSQRSCRMGKQELNNVGDINITNKTTIVRANRTMHESCWEYKVNSTEIICDRNHSRQTWAQPYEIFSLELRPLHVKPKAKNKLMWSSNMSLFATFKILTLHLTSYSHRLMYGMDSILNYLAAVIMVIIDKWRANGDCWQTFIEIDENYFKNKKHTKAQNLMQISIFQSKLRQWK